MDFYHYRKHEHEPVPLPADLEKVEPGVTYTFAMPVQPVPKWIADKVVCRLKDPTARIVPSPEFSNPYIGMSEEDKTEFVKQFQPPTLPNQI